MSMRYSAGFISAFYNPLKNPDAPTIGTASPASTTSLSIAFTAPSNVGGSAITSYLATAKRTSDGVLFTVSGASSPITVTGLTAVPFTVTVVAVNSYGPSASSAASNSVTPAMQVGDAYAGGFFAGQISTAGNGIADYNLVVGPVASAQSTLQWKTVGTTTSGTSSVIDGPTNSSNMNNASHPAAKFCEGLTIGGFSDWYMPALNEVEVCYFGLKPTTATNTLGAGVNLNAVPSRPSGYTLGNPAQTSATNFQTGGTEVFTTTTYWTSTEYNGYSAVYAWALTFNTGNTTDGVKTSSNKVRAIRRVAV
jgi:hypothetical protein